MLDIIPNTFESLQVVIRGQLQRTARAGEQKRLDVFVFEVNTGLTHILKYSTIFPGKKGGFLLRAWCYSPQKCGATSQMCLFGGNMKYHTVVVERLILASI